MKDCRLVKDFLLPSLNNETFGELLHWDEVNSLNHIFNMKWTHKSRRTWTESDCAVFAAWDEMKGRPRPVDAKGYVDSKQRLRAALRNIKTIQEVDCAGGFRKYRFADLNETNELQLPINKEKKSRKRVKKTSAKIKETPKLKDIADVYDTQSIFKDIVDIHDIALNIWTDKRVLRPRKNKPNLYTTAYESEDSEDGKPLPKRNKARKNGDSSKTAQEKEKNEIINFVEGTNLPKKKRNRKSAYSEEDMEVPKIKRSRKKATRKKYSRKNGSNAVQTENTVYIINAERNDVMYQESVRSDSPKSNTFQFQNSVQVSEINSDAHQPEPCRNLYLYALENNLGSSKPDHAEKAYQDKPLLYEDERNDAGKQLMTNKKTPEVERMSIKKETNKKMMKKEHETKVVFPGFIPAQSSISENYFGFPDGYMFNTYHADPNMMECEPSFESNHLDSLVQFPELNPTTVDTMEEWDRSPEVITLDHEYYCKPVVTVKDEIPSTSAINDFRQATMNSESVFQTKIIPKEEKPPSTNLEEAPLNQSEQFNLNWNDYYSQANMNLKSAYQNNTARNIKKEEIPSTTISASSDSDSLFQIQPSAGYSYLQPMNTVQSNSESLFQDNNMDRAQSSETIQQADQIKQELNTYQYNTVDSYVGLLFQDAEIYQESSGNLYSTSDSTSSPLTDYLYPNNTDASDIKFELQNEYSDPWQGVEWF